MSEPICEGFPFFRGTLSVTQKILVDESVTHLRIDGTYQSATVHMNGKTAGTLLFNQTLEIKDFLKPGENEVQIDFVISNRNLLGPHHCVEKTSRISVAPYLWELTNEWQKDGKTGYRSSYELLKLCAQPAE